MRKLISFFLAIAAWMPMIGQNSNPQQNFNAQVQLASPSLWMNYNDLTASFADSVSGLGFLGHIQNALYSASCTNSAASSASSTTCVMTAAAGDGVFIFLTGTVSAITSVTDSAGATFTKAFSPSTTLSVWYATNLTAASHTFTANFSSAQSYPVMQGTDVQGMPTTSPIDAYNSNIVTTSATTWTSNSITTTDGANELLVGFILGSSNTYTLTAPVFTAQSPGGWTGIFQAHYNATSLGSYSFTGTMTNSTGYMSVVLAIKGAHSSNTIATRQPGFDSTNPANYSAGFPYNGFNVAPNNTIGAIDWSSPWSMLLHIDRLNWNRTGKLILASKGDSSSTANNWWKLYLTQTGTPGSATLCFARNGPNPSGPNPNAGDTTCTSYDIANGYSYDVVVTDNGKGSSGYSTGSSPSTALYVNGTGSGAAPTTTTSNSYNTGFGNVYWTVSGGGTGYASSTAFTVTGGGANCTVTGTATASGGVIASVASPGVTSNFGCTSVPTIVLTSPTGTGATIVGHLGGASMNSTSYPVMAPGYVSAGAYNGIDQTDSTQTSTNVDEFAVWNRTLTPTEIYSLFYQTKFYQAILPAVPTHIPVIVNETVCGDYDSTTTASVAIKLHQLGYINLLGLAVESDGGLGAALFRQMLDQAGLNNVPMGMASNSSTFSSADGGLCTHANMAAYNASTPTTYTAFQTTSQMYRKIFAANPTTAITLLTPTTLFGTYDFMNSAADGISSLTGAQLWLQNKTNGGSMYLQGGPFCGQTASLPVTSPCSGSVTGDNSLFYPTQGQYVLNNLQGMPLYMMAGSPDANGPGALYTRTSTDPLYLASVTYGNDSRTGWDSLGTMAILTPLFSGSVQIAYSGGTGYANATQITSTGGGANCHVDGWLTASGGVPNGIVTSYGHSYGSVAWQYVYGYGCTSVPTLNLVSPTGTGVTLTAYLSEVCGTDTITYPSSVWTDSFSSTTCSNQYTVAFPWQAFTASGSSGSPIYRWLLNSLENPVPVGQPRAQ